METSTQSLLSTPYRSAPSRAYQTTYQREFSSLKRSLTIDEGIPTGQRYLIGSPYQLNDPVGVSSYTIDYSNQKNTQIESIVPLKTTKVLPWHSNSQSIHCFSRPVTVAPVISEETKQALRNQLNSTYQVDYTGAPQGFPLTLAYNRSRSFWRNRGHHTLDSEYRSSYEQPLPPMIAPPGRYKFSCRIPADAIVPLTLPMWRKKSSKTTYDREFSEKAPSQLHMKDFVDSFSGPMDQ